MKAVSFLEWYKDNSCFSRVTIDEDISSLNYVANFYSQPFRPEMITELFEGWAYRKTIMFHEYTKMRGSYKNLDIINVSEKVVGYNIFGDKDYAFITPATLNDFISDCNRAGIELHWKPEIEKEYFA